MTLRSVLMRLELGQHAKMVSRLRPRMAVTVPRESGRTYVAPHLSVRPYTYSYQNHSAPIYTVSTGPSQHSPFSLTNTFSPLAYIIINQPTNPLHIVHILLTFLSVDCRQLIYFSHSYLNPPSHLSPPIRPTIFVFA